MGQEYSNLMSKNSVNNRHKRNNDLGLLGFGSTLERSKGIISGSTDFIDDSDIQNTLNPSLH